MKKTPKYCQRCGAEIINSTDPCENCGARRVPPHLTALFWAFAGAMFAVVALLVMLALENTRIEIGPESSEATQNIAVQANDIDLGYGLTLLDGTITISENGPVCYFGGRIRNDSKKDYDIISVHLSYFDDAGNQIGTTIILTSNLQSGIVWKFSDSVVRNNEHIASCRISNVRVD